MSISFQCEHCRKEIKAPDNAGGQRGKCPYCGGSTYVPAAGDDEQALPLTPVDNEAERRHEEELHRLVDQELSQLDEDDMREQVPLDQRDEVSSRDLHHFVVNYCLDMAAGKLDRAETHAEKLAAYGKTGTLWATLWSRRWTTCRPRSKTATSTSSARKSVRERHRTAPQRPREAENKDDALCFLGLCSLENAALTTSSCSRCLR
jgi:hypothetical protein